MIEIDCICCGAEIERHEYFAMPIMQSMCEACAMEVSSSDLLTQEPERATDSHWLH